MDFEIRFSPTAARQFAKLRDEKLRSRIIASLEHLGRDPHAGKPLHGELKGDRSYRTGAFRIVYHVDLAEKSIGILRVEHRSEVYR